MQMSSNRFDQQNEGFSHKYHQRQMVETSCLVHLTAAPTQLPYSRLACTSIKRVKPDRIYLKTSSFSQLVQKKIIRHRQQLFIAGKGRILIGLPMNLEAASHHFVFSTRFFHSTFEEGGLRLLTSCQLDIDFNTPLADAHESRNNH